MERILLINPPTSLERRYGTLRDIAPSDFPIGLAYIAAYLRKRGYGVDVLDSQVTDISEALLKQALSRDYLYVGVSSVTSTFHSACNLAASIKRIIPSQTIVFGGVHVSALPEESLQNNSIDVVVRGEGERTAYELAKALSGGSLRGVDGISYREGCEIVHNRSAERIAELDDIPTPARDLFPMAEYRPQPDMVYRRPSFSMMTSRGCLGRCIFCSPRVITGRGYRFHSPKRVLDETEMLVEDYGAKQIIFWDDTMAANRRRMDDICAGMVERRLSRKIVWFCESRVNQVTPELLKTMREAGCRVISYGIETASQESLDFLKKDITLQQIRDAVRWTKDAGIECRGTLMIGLPNESMADMENTIGFAKDLGLDRAKFTIMTPYPGTEFYGMVKDKLSASWDEYNTLAGYTEFNPVYSPEGITPEELKTMQKKAMREFYLRPIQLLRLLRCVRSWGQVETYARGGLTMLRR